jgi:hypothetical protein
MDEQLNSLWRFFNAKSRKVGWVENPTYFSEEKQTFVFLFFCRLVSIQILRNIARNCNFFSVVFGCGKCFSDFNSCQIMS